MTFRNKAAPLLKEKSYFTRYHLPKTTSALPDDKKGVLKVKTLQESLDSIRSPRDMKAKGSIFRRSLQKGSFRFTSFRGSLKGNVPFRGSLKGKSHGRKESLTELEFNSDQSQSMEVVKNDVVKKVSFTDTETRLYHITTDDNPGVSGKGPAIALGWKYEVENPVSVDDFEANRGPTQKLVDLKISMKERQELLLQSGATMKELQAFAKRVQKAKTQRLETKEALNVYGKANMDKAEQRAVKQQNFISSIKKRLGLRKSDDKRQAELWRMMEQRGSIAIAAQ